MTEVTLKKPRHTNPSKLIHDNMVKKGLKAYTPIHIYGLIKKKFVNGDYTQRSEDTYKEWLGVKEKYNNWD